MPLVFNAKSYIADMFQKDQVGYIGILKTVSAKDDLKLSRTAPNPSAAFSGLGRSAAKLSRTLALTGALTPKGDAIIEVNVAVPVGFASADVDSLLDDAGAFVSSAEFKTLVKSQKINF